MVGAIFHLALQRQIGLNSDLFVGIGDALVDGLAEVVRELPRPLECLDVLLGLVQDRVERHEVAGVHLNRNCGTILIISDQWIILDEIIL